MSSYQEPGADQDPMVVIRGAFADLSQTFLKQNPDLTSAEFYNKMVQLNPNFKDDKIFNFLYEPVFNIEKMKMQYGDLVK